MVSFNGAWSDIDNSWEGFIYISNDFYLLGAEFIQVGLYLNLEQKFCYKTPFQDNFCLKVSSKNHLNSFVNMFFSEKIGKILILIPLSSTFLQSNQSDNTSRMRKKWFWKSVLFQVEIRTDLYNLTISDKAVFLIILKDNDAPPIKMITPPSINSFDLLLTRPTLQKVIQ